jgi:N-acylneuraminate cytidylyltransferase
MSLGVIIPNLSKFHTIVFDFDGVFTDNRVFIDQNGNEMVCCDRADGLGFDLLRGYISRHSLPLAYFILSKEKNSVVKKRAEKLQIPCYFGVSNKLEFLKDYLRNKAKNSAREIQGVLYVGNDLNDYLVMREVGFSVAPQDAHPRILDIASAVLLKNGGDGFVRCLIEKLIGLDDCSEEDLNEIVRNC